MIDIREERYDVSTSEDAATTDSTRPRPVAPMAIAEVSHREAVWQMAAAGASMVVR